MQKKILHTIISHNILELFDVLPNSLLTTSETTHDFYL